MLKRLLNIHSTDEKVKALHRETKQNFIDTAQSAHRLNELLLSNGVTMQIIVATGGDRRKSDRRKHGNK